MENSMDCQDRSWAYKDSAAELTLRGSCVPHQLQWVAKQPFLRCTALCADMLHTPVCYTSRWNRFLSSLHNMSSNIVFFLYSRHDCGAPCSAAPKDTVGAMRSATGRILRSVFPILSLSCTSGPYFYVITNHRSLFLCYY
jgi:hypothetical protein